MSAEKEEEAEVGARVAPPAPLAAAAHEPAPRLRVRFKLGRAPASAALPVAPPAPATSPAERHAQLAAADAAWAAGDVGRAQALWESVFGVKRLHAMVEYLDSLSEAEASVVEGAAQHVLLRSSLEAAEAALAAARAQAPAPAVTRASGGEASGAAAAAAANESMHT